MVRRRSAPTTRQEETARRELEQRLQQQSEVAKLGVRALSGATLGELCAEGIEVLRQGLAVEGVHPGQLAD